MRTAEANPNQRLKGILCASSRTASKEDEQLDRLKTAQTLPWTPAHTHHCLTHTAAARASLRVSRARPQNAHLAFTLDLCLKILGAMFYAIRQNNKYFY